MQPLTAYDYEAQRWVHGEDARALLIRQTEHDLALILSPEGPAYLRSVNGPSVERAARDARQFIVSLRARIGE